MNIYTPERHPDESFEQYKIRRRMGQLSAKLWENPPKPTLFVQHQPNIDKKKKKEQNV